MDINNLCMGCMNEKNVNYNVCPYCGFDEREYQLQFHHLPLRTILGAKILVGKVLGEGGFGITYIGIDLNLNLPVAVKEFYPSGFVTRENNVTTSVSAYQGSGREYFESSREKFVDEARRLAKFRNLPGIVSVQDFFMENGTAYIVMEYISGETLKTYITKQGGKLPTKTLLSMLYPVMSSLSRMHEAGIIHRDISPDNIMITQNGEMKLIDFGASRDYSQEANHSLSVMLKPGYAPIEQYSSKGVQGPWSDVYAICATIYKCITGVTPEEASDRALEDTMKNPSTIGADIDSIKEAVLLKGMAFLAKNRYQSIGELVANLYDESSNTITPKETISHTSDSIEPIQKQELHSNQVRISGKIIGIIASMIVGLVVIGVLVVGGIEPDEQVAQIEELELKENSQEVGSSMDSEDDRSNEMLENDIVHTVEEDLSSKFSVGLEYYEAEDYQEALKIFEPLAEGGHAESQHYMGKAYLNGESVEIDYEKAMEWFIKAAEQEFPGAVSNIGYMYFNGLGVEKDEEEAMKWYLNAAELGNPNAQYNLGLIYQEKNDHRTAMDWYMKAAEQNFAEALNNIGTMNSKGHGVPGVNYEKAMELYLQAAALGSDTAIYNIGMLYYDGYGVSQDRDEAKKWLEQAAEQGNKSAIERLEDNY